MSIDPASSDTTMSSWAAKMADEWSRYAGFNDPKFNYPAVFDLFTTDHVGTHRYRFVDIDKLEVFLKSYAFKDCLITHEISVDLATNLEKIVDMYREEELRKRNDPYLNLRVSARELS